MQEELTEAEWRNLLKEYAECQTHPGIYILGCFARHVTLYSQQVRALNLIYGLHKTGQLKEGDSIVVIGAGAAGLMAAAAAAYLKCQVILLEEMEGPMELQRNNRQRWIHPHIYDWPDPDSREEDAELPLLNWRAGYAEQIARQIEEKWLECVRQNPVEEVYSVEKLQFHANHGKSEMRYTLGWTGDYVDKERVRPPHRKTQTVYVNHILVAVGFGLEPRSPGRDSYWTEDDTDVSFRKQQGQRWLVSGFGDGALTDLMRLCLRRFRHAEIANLFDTTAGIPGVIADIERIHSNPNLSDEELSHAFSKLSAGGLEEVLKRRLRSHGPEVVLSGQHPHLYGRGSSVLNRLIVYLLSELGAFGQIFGPTGPIRQEGDKFLVEYGTPPNTKTECFDRVIVRHGPNSLIEGLAQSWGFGESCQRLKQSWKEVSPRNDLSRRQQWPTGFFGPEGESPASGATEGDRAFAESVSRFGVKIAKLTFYKEVRDEGSSTVTYSVEGLTAVDRPISGVRFYYESVAGKIGPAALDKRSKSQGLRWFRDRPREHPATMDELRGQVRRVSGTVRFPQPLKPSDPALNFKLRMIVLNGDALSKSEYEQLYIPANRFHIDREKIKSMEYFARIVWCPVESLKIQLILPPDRSLGVPRPSVFGLPASSVIEPEEVVRESVVQFYPPPRWQPHKVKWANSPADTVTDSFRFANPAAQTWELSVQKPRVGSCYSLDWTLPAIRSGKELLDLEDRAKALRSRLLQYRNARRGDRSTLPAHQKRKIRESFLKLHADVAALQKKSGVKEDFDIAFMTYNDFTTPDCPNPRLEFVDGTSAGGEPNPALWTFWLPFGLGLAGACFKQGDRSYIYFRKQVNEEKIAPEYYLSIPGTRQHSFMVAVPVDHPTWDESMAQKGFERSRQCIGVVDISISSGSQSRWFEAIQSSNNNTINDLRPICQNFGDRIAGILE